MISLLITNSPIAPYLLSNERKSEPLESFSRPYTIQTLLLVLWSPLRLFHSYWFLALARTTCVQGMLLPWARHPMTCPSPLQVFAQISPPHQVSQTILLNAILHPLHSVSPSLLYFSPVHLPLSVQHNLPTNFISCAFSPVHVRSMRIGIFICWLLYFIV